MARKPILRVIEGPAKGTEFAIQDGFYIGRGDDCQINTQDQTTSRKHAQINREKDGFRLVDLESANGMLINKRKLRSHYIKHNDVITMGDTTFVVEFIVDPAIQRRNMRIAIAMVIIVIAAVAHRIYQNIQEEIELARPVVRQLDTIYENDQFGIQVKYPYSTSVEQYDYRIRPWSTAYERAFWKGGPWSSEYPELGNGMTSENVTLDAYMRLTFVETIRAEKTEFYRFQVDAYDGLQTWAGLSDYGITDKYLPQQKRFDNIRLNNIEQGEHPEYGPYEQITEVYKTSSGLDFYAKQRVYVVGRRRYVLTATTKNSMLDRVNPLLEDFINNGLVIDVKAAKAAPSKMADEELFQLGEKLYQEAERMNRNSTVLTNRQYRAFLRYQKALEHFRDMSRPTTDYDKALKKMRSLRLGINAQLSEIRDACRDDKNYVRWVEARDRIQDIRVLLDTTDEPYAPPYTEEWLLWCDDAAQSVLEAEIHSKKTDYLKVKDLARVY